MKNEEKELWEIAHDAYINNTTTASQDWKAVVQSVITEHERRKAEQVKPEPEIPWIQWHGGECPLKDDEVEQWEFMLANGESCKDLSEPSTYSWQAMDSRWDIIAYRVLKWKVKPEWKLPDPPEGAAWHRTDWTQDMLPEGWRPLLAVEHTTKGDDVSCDGKHWTRHIGLHWKLSAGDEPNWFQRTTRPLPVKPDPFAAEKAAFAQGKTIQFKGRESAYDWSDCYTAPGWFSDCEYRIKPDPVLVPLGPDDVPPGSLHFCDTNGYLWLSIVAVTDKGICTTHGFTDFGSLFRCNTHKINRQDGLGWVPCSKPKQD